MTRKRIDKSRRNVLKTTSALLVGAVGAGATAGAVTAAPSPPAYDSSATYNGGDRVTFEGSIWEAE